MNPNHPPTLPHDELRRRTPRPLRARVAAVATSLGALGALCGLAMLVALGGCGESERVATLEAKVAALEAQLAEPKVTRLSVVDKEGKERAMFGLREEDQAPALRLKDETGRNRVLLRLHPDGTPILVLWGQDGKGTAYLSVPGEGPPSLMFFDKVGQQPVKLP